MKRIIAAAMIAVTGPAMAGSVLAVGQALNQLRAEHGLPRVRYSPALERAAEAHATDMARNHFFAHRGSDGAQVGSRARRAGYRYCFVAENIAKGQKNLDTVMQAWAHSPGHMRNMLDSRAIDYAIVRGPDNIWVMVLGRPGC